MYSCAVTPSVSKPVEIRKRINNHNTEVLSTVRKHTHTHRDTHTAVDGASTVHRQPI